MNKRNSSTDNIRMQPSDNSADTKKKMFMVIIAVIMVWGMALRSVELISGNYLFGLDHGRDYLAGYSIAKTHKLTLIGAEAGSGAAGINGIFHGPGYFYLIALSVLLFGGNPYGGMVFMALFGFAALGFSVWYGLKLAGRLNAVLVAFFVAVSPLIVSQSRFIWSSHPITVFVLISMYCAYLIPRRPALYAPLSVFFAAFTYNSQLGVSVPLTVSVLLSLPFVYGIRSARVYIYSVLALLVGFAPMMLFEVRHGFMAVRSAVAYVSQGGSGSSGGFLEPLRFSRHLFDYWNNFYNTFTFEFGWIPWKQQMTFLYAVIPVVIYGLLRIRESALRRYVVFIFLMTVTTHVSYLLLNNTVWDYYLTHTRIGYVTLFSLGLTHVFASARRSMVSRAASVIGVLFLLTVGIGSLFRMNVSYTVDIHDQGVIDKIAGKQSVIDLLYRDAAGKPFSVFVFVPPIYTYAYDYLFKTYGVSTYGYEPGKEKQGTVYLIIEPDTGQPWRQKGWLETVVDGGSVVWKKTVLNSVEIIKKQFP